MNEVQELLKCRQTDANGNTVIECIINSPYSEIDLAEDVTRVEFTGNAEIFEIIKR